MAKLDIKDIIEDLVKKILDDDKLQDLFKKDPVKVIENLIDIDLPDDLIDGVIDGVKAGIAADKIGDAAKLLKKLF